MRFFFFWKRDVLRNFGCSFDFYPKKMVVMPKEYWIIHHALSNDAKYIYIYILKSYKNKNTLLLSVQVINGGIL